MNDIRIIITSDGSHSLLNESLNETYHSVHGAVRESKHVFLEHGLTFFVNRQKASAVRILEVGFGTGLNALLTLLYSRTFNIAISYTSLEAYPLPQEVWSALNYGDELGDPDAFKRIHQVPWEEEIFLEPTFGLRKMHTMMETAELDAADYDIVFFDAFAPAKQPELWTLPVLTNVIGALRPGGVFVTYCAKGQLKRDLRALCSLTEALPGPPGKREMLRATK